MKKNKILICVSGGIAAYKACSLVNDLIKKNMEVRVVMSDSARKFVSPLTFESLTNSQVFHDLWDDKNGFNVRHIEIAHWADVVIVSPATANSIGKIANGITDNFLTTVISALPDKTAVIFAPAMNVNMWKNPIIQKNITFLKSLGKYIFVEPRNGVLACRDEGMGKIAKNSDIIDVLMKKLQ